MQKLSVELKNAPWGAPQAPRSASGGLNREVTLSGDRKVLADNGSDVDRQSGKTEQDPRVPVLNMRGEPLMPTTPGKARRLLDQDKAEVVCRKPFSIQLKYATGENKQPLKLGKDPGYEQTGISIVDKENEREVFGAEVRHRTDIPRKMLRRSKYRRNRRNRLWYRKPRFDNPKTEDGWLAPSVEHKLDSNVRLTEKLKELFPITETVIEVAKFDQQKMRNPEIEGIEYQHGTLYGYNVKHYLLEKFDYQCVYCGDEDVPLEVEHIVPKSRGGTDRVDNLTISCPDCNQEKGDQTAEEFGHPEVQERAKETLKETAFMNQVRWKLVDELDAEPTYGHITKKNRTDMDIEKSHINDAFVIAEGTDDMERCKHITSEQVRRNNRSLQITRKRYGRSIRKQRYDLQPNDLVRYESKEHRVKGVHCKGSRVVLDNGKSVSIKDVELVCYGKGLFS